jgi:KDO2-lipid IV(A) lauroyltransferase
MSKPRSIVTDYAVYLLIRIVACVIQALPGQAARNVTGALAWLAYRIDKRHREVARDNLRHAFPGQPPEPADHMVRDVYRHFLGLLADIMQTPRRLNPNNWRRHVDLETGRAIVGALLSGRPLLFVTGHFGNWEMGGYVLGLLGFRTAAIARRLDNRFLHDYLGRFRQGTGQTILDKNDDYDQICSTLASGGALATLGDQDAGPRGLFVDFFGRPASTHKAVALLALEYNAVMVVIGVPRVGDPLRYRIFAADVIRPEEYAGRPDAVKAMTQRFTTALERAVRSAPEQYFWLHRRWKHQPAVRARKQAA